MTILQGIVRHAAGLALAGAKATPPVAEQKAPASATLGLEAIHREKFGMERQPCHGDQAAANDNEAVENKACVSRYGGIAFLIRGQDSRKSLTQVEGYYHLGLVRESETPEKLARVISSDPSTLAASIDTYKKAQTCKNDVEFKRPDRPHPVKTGSTIAIEVRPGIHDTMAASQSTGKPRPLARRTRRSRASTPAAKSSVAFMALTVLAATRFLRSSPSGVSPAFKPPRTSKRHSP